MDLETKSGFWTWKKLICLLVLSIVLSLAYAWRAHVAKIDAKLAALRAAGFPTSGSELNDYYRVPAGVADSTELWVEAIDAVEAADLYYQGKSLPFIGDPEAELPPPGEAWDDLEAWRALLTELESELQSIRGAAETGGQVRFPVDFMAGISYRISSTVHSRNVAKLLWLDAHVSAHVGNVSRSLRDLVAIFALSDALRGEPTLSSQFTRRALYLIGCDGLRQLLPHCNWSDADLESLQRTVSAAGFRAELRQAYIGERAVLLTALNQLPIGPLRPANKQELLELFDIIFEALSYEWPGAMLRLDAAEKRKAEFLESRFERYTLFPAYFYQPAGENSFLGAAGAEARRKCAIAVIAAQRYRLKHGRLPRSLAEIEPELLGTDAENPVELIDPFDGQPLRFRNEAARILIYSISYDLQDDGGRIEPDETSRAADVGFSLDK